MRRLMPITGLFTALLVLSSSVTPAMVSADSTLSGRFEHGRFSDGHDDRRNGDSADDLDCATQHKAKEAACHARRVRPARTEIGRAHV